MLRRTLGTHWECIRTAVGCKLYRNLLLISSDGVAVAFHQSVLASLSPLIQHLLLETPSENPVLLLPDFTSTTIHQLAALIHTGQTVGSDDEMEIVSVLFGILGIRVNGLAVSPVTKYYESSEDEEVVDSSEMVQCVLQDEEEPVAPPSVPLVKRRGRGRPTAKRSQPDNDPEYAPDVQCRECGRSFTSETNLIQHMTTHMKTHHSKSLRQRITYPCGQCGKIFIKSSGLKRHNRFVHEGQKPCKCDMCDKAFSTANHLQRHMRTHETTDISHEKPADGNTDGNADVPAEACSVCGKTFSTSLLLRRHLVNHSATSNKTFQCDRCMKCFPRSSSLWRHVRSVHEGWKPFHCVLCPKAFSSEDHLKRHTQTHSRDRAPRAPSSAKGVPTDPKPCLCPICGKVFTSNHNIAQHMRIHSGEKPFGCKVCGKAFSCKSYLKDHNRIHTGEKPFQCTVCGKTFKCRSHLCEHNRIHTGERPFRCSVCGKSFSHGNHLKKHMSIHSGEKPYECSICGKYFSRGYNRNAHMKIHFKQ